MRKSPTSQQTSQHKNGESKEKKIYLGFLTPVKWFIYAFSTGKEEPSQTWLIGLSWIQCRDQFELNFNSSRTIACVS